MSYGKNVYDDAILWELKPALLSQINGAAFSARGLDETFRGSGFTNIGRELLSGFTTLTGLFETFREMPHLGQNWYALKNTENAWAVNFYPLLHPSSGPGTVNTDEILSADRSFIPIDLLWYSPNLLTIEGLFNASLDNFGQTPPNYYNYCPPVRREFFWNGKAAGNTKGTLTNINLVFYKRNRITFDTDLFAYIKDSLWAAIGTFSATYQSTVALQNECCMSSFTHDIAEIMGFTKGSNIGYQEPDKTDTAAGDKDTGIPNREYLGSPEEMKAMYPNLVNIDMLFGGEGQQPSSFNARYGYGYNTGHDTTALDVEAFTACFNPSVSHKGTLYISDNNMLNKANVDDGEWFIPIAV
jgi:hypothetical protein